jgi:hypothetical protein
MERERDMVHLTSERDAAVISQESPAMGEPVKLRAAAEIEAERLAFKRDRYGHNHSTSSVEAKLSRITYMAHAKGYVMCRRPGCIPFVITEAQWRGFPFYEETI